MTAAHAEPPRRIGRYTVLRTVEQRGLFVTVAARHELGHEAYLHTTAEHVVPRPELGAALEEEARAASTLPHDAVCSFIELVEDGERRAVAYQAPEGPSLREVLERARKRGGLEPSEALALLVALARSVALLHQRGVVHGGLCPERCHLGAHSASLRLRGLRWPASVADASSSESSRRQSSSEELAPEHGAYRAPEQILGRVGSAASDVFALGLIGYELLAGKHPFEPGSGPEVAQRLRHAEPPPIARRPSRLRFARSIAEDLEVSLRGMLAKSEALRPASALEVLRDLEPMSRELGIEPVISALLARLELGAIELGRGASLEPAPRLAATLAPRLVAIAVAMALATAFFGAREPTPRRGQTSSPDGVGRIRVLARPWAEVHLDGERVDLTPIGAPLEVRPGAHELVFRHPAAVEERRRVDVGPGQLVTVDVVMKVVRTIDAGVDPSP